MLSGKVIQKLIPIGISGIVILGCLWAPGVGLASPGSPVAQDAPAEPAAQTALTIKGQFVPRHTASLGFTNGGPVDQIYVQEGDLVEAGDTLIHLDNSRQYEAQIAAGELDLLNAQQALDDLNEHAAQDLALAEKRLADAQKVQDAANWKVISVSRGTSQEDIDQAYANLLLTEKQVQNANDDLKKAEKQWNDKSSILWKFVKTHDYKLMLYNLQRSVANAEKRYDDALQKYNDRLKPVDEIDLAQAEAALAVANAQVSQAENERQKLLNGPDPDQVKLAQARIQKAQAALDAATAAQKDATLHTPISGQVLKVNYKAGEWIPPLRPAVIIAELSDWTLEIDDLAEDQVPGIQAGQPVQVSVDALPDLTLNGKVESVSQVAGEKHGDVTYTVKIGIQGNDPRLRWGMTGEARLGGG